ncbi:hypothetical protein, partial [Nosocomiicoccus sp. HMSC09A07]|uniref:hypothetical protein n=1 Tax=Nosocomiicoccus sp. HMSC09A07 TaxID=1581145 RepID=UPI001AEFA21D
LFNFTQLYRRYSISHFSPTILHFASVYQKLADDNPHSDGELFISPTIQDKIAKELIHLS